MFYLCLGPGLADSILVSNHAASCNLDSKHGGWWWSNREYFVNFEYKLSSITNINHCCFYPSWQHPGGQRGKGGQAAALLGEKGKETVAEDYCKKGEGGATTWGGGWGSGRVLIR